MDRRSHLWELTKLQKTLDMHRMWLEFLFDFDPLTHDQTREKNQAIEHSYDTIVELRERLTTNRIAMAMADI